MVKFLWHQAKPVSVKKQAVCGVIKRATFDIYVSSLFQSLYQTLCGA
jgi:hypothetical protein